MGCALARVMAVSQRELLAVPGSRRQDIIDGVAEGYPELEAIAEAFEDDDLPIDLVEAVAHIIDGKDLLPECGSLYLYAVEAICWHLGGWFTLPFPFPGEEALDAFLAPQGCPVRLVDLGSCGSPLAIPEPGYPPSIGWWRADQVAEATQFFSRIRDAGLEARMRSGIAAVRRWLKRATELRDGCLVGTWY